MSDTKWLKARLQISKQHNHSFHAEKYFCAAFKRYPILICNTETLHAEDYHKSKSTAELLLPNP